MLVLNPTHKDLYLRAAWEEEYVDAGMKRFKEIVSFLIIYDYAAQSVSLKYLRYKSDYDQEQKEKTEQARRSTTPDDGV